MKLCYKIVIIFLICLSIKLKAGDIFNDPKTFSYTLRSDNRLINAIIHNEPANEIIQLLNKINTQDLDKPDSFGQLSFIAALIKGNPEVINAFLKKTDLAINKEDEVYDPYTPLAAALITGNEKVINWLINKNADVSKKFGTNQETALIRALRHTINQKVVTGVRALLSHQALQNKLAEIVNMQDKNGNTALHIVIRVKEGDDSKQILEIMKLLVDAGADPSIENRSYHTPAAQLTTIREVPEYHNMWNIISRASTNPLIRAILNDESRDTILKLATRQYINMTDSAGKTPIIEAIAKFDDVEFIKKLVTKGASIEADKKGITPLKAAIDSGHEEIVRWLLDDRKVDVNQLVKGATPLISAVDKDNLNIARMLIEKGADVNKKVGARGETALMAAAQKGNAEMIQLLLESGAQVNMQDNWNATALIYAVKQYWDLYTGSKLDSNTAKDLKNSIELLIKHGASTSIKDQSGNSAETYASQVPALESILEEAKEQPIETTQMLANRLIFLAYDLTVLRLSIRA